MYSIQNSVMFRLGIRIKLKRIICNDVGTPNAEDDVVENTGDDAVEENKLYETIATNLEKGIFNYTIREATTRNVIKKWDNTKFCQIYIDRLRSIYLNLKNPEFLGKIQRMEINPSEYVTMTHQNIQPELWKEMIEKKNQIEESMLSVNIKANTDLYTCKKCKSRNIYFTETQTRSADEQSTITLLCLSCGKRWNHG
jgi:DNA-directed RNA polymerase subunit M/transcription elongation factor TFIIS